MTRYGMGWGVLLILGGCGCPGDYEPSSSGSTLAPLRATSRPYVIKGQTYHPKAHYEHEEVGIASYYGGPDGCHGLPTASAEIFDMYTLTAAHKTLPIPCVVLVTNLSNGQQATLRVNDRGPFKDKRILDVSVAAAQKLGFYRQGTAPVHIKCLVQESLSLVENQRAFEKARKKMGQRTKRVSTAKPVHCSIDDICEVLGPPPPQRGIQAGPPRVSCASSAGIESLL